MPAMLTAIIEQDDIHRGYRTFRATMTRGTKGETRWIGFQGGQVEGEVRWLDGEGYWCCLADSPPRKGWRYWSAFGVVPRADARDPLIITTEINPPREGINRRVAGILARDSAGGVFLLHTGRIGGGKPGVGRSAFLSYLESPNLQDVAWPDGEVTRAVLIGRIDRPTLRSQVGEFVRQVAAFKSGAPAPLPTPNGDAESNYSDEFAGRRRAYRVSDLIEATCNHGHVIRCLRRMIESAKAGTIGKDTARDLYIRHGGRVVILFEAKTDTTPQSIYTGIGQLMLHGAAQSPPALRVLVLPRKPDARTGQRLTALGVEVVTYTLRGTEATFSNLGPVLRKASL